jgi:hypothetical protein
VVVSSSGQLGVTPSAARFKRDIRPMGAASGGLMRLRPVTFVYKHDPVNTRQYGLVAEEVRQVYPELVIYDGNGQLMTVRYEQIPMLVNELQGQHRELAEQRRELAEVHAENRSLRSVVAQMQKSNGGLVANN